MFLQNTRIFKIVYFKKNFKKVLFKNIFRWIKFEEDVEENGERWSKPHVATLPLFSLFELRCCLANAVIMLNLEAYTMEEITGDLDFNLKCLINTI